MVRPVLPAAALAAAGTLAGLGGVRADMRLAACCAAALVIIAISLRSPHGATERSRAPLIFAFIFLVFLLRAAAESHRYENAESEAFFSSYSISTPGQFDYGTYLKGIGIGTKEAYGDYLDDVPAGGPVGKAAAGVRSYIGNKLSEYMTVDDAGIYKAILLGDKSELNDDISGLYKASGISHLLAISGLHVSILGGGLFKLLNDRLKLRRAHSSLIASLALCFYSLMCGMGSSVVRASVMLGLSFLAFTRLRSYDMRSAAGISLMLILLIHPYQLLLSGFELSFAAVAAIALLSPEIIRGIERRLKCMRGVHTRFTARQDRLPRPLKTIIMSLAIQLMTLPVLAWHYFTFPLYGFFLNFIVIPLMGIVLMSGLMLVLAASLADIAAIILAGEVPALTALTGLTAAPGHYVLKLYTALCRLNLSLPHSTIVTGRPSVYLVILYYLILFVSVYVLTRTDIRMPPASINININNNAAGDFGHALMIAGFFALILLNAALLKYYELKPFYIAALDVGQGDGFVIKAGDIYMTVDGGSSSDRLLGERVLEPYLLSKRIETVDMAVVSHADNDHVSGIIYILEESDNISVRRLCLPKAAEDSPEYDELKSLFIAGGGEESDVIYISDLQKIMETGDIRLTSIYAGNAASSDTNRHSDVILLEKGEDFSMLFTGDAGTEDEEEIAGLYRTAVDTELIGSGNLSVLKVAHHGSASSSSLEFLTALHPAVALLSYGEGNSYGHPHEEVIDRLKSLGIKIVSTADNGTLYITPDGIRPAL